MDDEAVVEGKEASFSVVAAVWTSGGPTTLRN
jgi:hypothetical protein